jgi:hypothetical protein
MRNLKPKTGRPPTRVFLHVSKACKYVQKQCRKTYDAFHCSSMDVCGMWSKNQDERVATGKSITMRR